MNQLNLDEFKPLTLLDARREMLSEVRNGMDKKCPCCSRLVKLYKRKLHAEMVLWLIALDRLCDDRDWHTTLEIVELSPHLGAGGTNGTLLIHWGLIEKRGEENRSGAPAGSYQVTAKGRSFLYCNSRVPARAHFLCGDLVGFSAEVTTARQAVGNKFDYDELIVGKAGSYA